MKKEYSIAIKHTGHVIDLWLPLRIKYNNTPGLSVGIVYKGKLLYVNGFGFANLKNKVTPDEKTVFRIASISKTFTAVSIMQLKEKGKLRLDDKVADYIDWFQARNKNNESKNITIRQLLSHSAGIFRDGLTAHWQTGDFPDELQSVFSGTSLVIENATKFKYTNYGYSLLGLVIEKASGNTYAEYVNENIIKPLKMEMTAPDYSGNVSNLATGYGRHIPEVEKTIFPHLKTNAFAPATGFASNVTDLAKYISALTLGSKSKLLSRESKKEMMHVHERTEEGDGYGLGFEISSVSKRKVVGHGGGFNGYITKVLFDPESELGVIVLTNSNSSSAGSIAWGILKMVYDGVDNSGKHKGKLPDYKAFEGIYRSHWCDTVIAQFGKDLLDFSVTINSPLTDVTKLIKTKEQNKFIMKMDDSVFDSYDEIAQFKDIQNGKAQTYVSGATPSKRVE